MSKMVNHTILDQALDYIMNNATQLIVCSAQPMNYTEATVTYALATQTGLTSGSFALADDVSGRKLTVAQQLGIAVANSGTAINVALCSGSVLLYATTCTSKVLAAGDKVDCPAWKINIQDPT
jgi:hypothetical protein